MNRFGTCFTPTSLWIALKEAGHGSHEVTVNINAAGDISWVKVKE